LTIVTKQTTIEVGNAASSRLGSRPRWAIAEGIGFLKYVNQREKYRVSVRAGPETRRLEKERSGFRRLLAENPRICGSTSIFKPLFLSWITCSP
jgi:hypothetical protein